MVVDDHLLLRVLLGNEPDDLRRPEEPIFTTGLWYHRMCRALLDPSIVGAISRGLGSAPREVAALAVGATVSLPDEIGLISLRDLAGPMAQILVRGAHLNLLSLEALAAAHQLGARLVLAADDLNPLLLAACRAFDVEVAVLS